MGTHRTPHLAFLDPLLFPGLKPDRSALMVYGNAPDLDAPAGWSIGRGERLFEGAMKTERTRRLRVIAIGPLTLGLRKGASRVPLLDEEGLVARHGRVVVPLVSRVLF